MSMIPTDTFTESPLLCDLAKRSYETTLEVAPELTEKVTDRAYVLATDVGEWAVQEKDRRSGSVLLAVSVATMGLATVLLVLMMVRRRRRRIEQEAAAEEAARSMVSDDGDGVAA